MRGTVVTMGSDARRATRDHDSASRAAVARRLAALLGLRFGGEYVAAERPSGRVYFVPADTVVGFDRAEDLGIRTPDDLFGAVVAHPFVPMKSITHSTLDAQARVPDGWSPEFAQRVAGDVLDGYSAFAREDAMRAAERLLASGPARIKRSKGIGGRGQWLVRSRDEVPPILEEIDDDELGELGVVVEEHLESVETYSVGQLCVAGIVATYWGTQSLTTNNAGTSVYGGSRLHLVRGGFDELLARPLDDHVRTAVVQARAYDAAAFDCHRMFASRRNYDVARGVDARGRRRSGVLEQSWRIGGASAAEVLALEAFAADGDLHQTSASTVEVYGASDAPPAGAFVHFRGVDERVGAITKYATIDIHAHT
jgi:hypothetical protein